MRIISFKHLKPKATRRWAKFKMSFISRNANKHFSPCLNFKSKKSLIKQMKYREELEELADKGRKSWITQATAKSTKQGPTNALPFV